MERRSQPRHDRPHDFAYSRAEASTERVQRHRGVGVLVGVDPDDDLVGWRSLLQGEPPLSGWAPAAARSDRTVTGPRRRAPIRSRPTRTTGAAREADKSMR